MAEPAPDRLARARSVVTSSTVTTPEERRPRSETLDGVAQWLRTEARRETSLAKVIDELAWRLVAAGFSLLRVSLNAGELHPQFLGASYLWWRDTAQTQKVMIAHEVLDIVPRQDNPIIRARENGEVFRRRLDRNEKDFDFSILHDLKARGGTDYYTFPLPSPFGFTAYVMGYVSEAPGGFRQAEIDFLTTLSRDLALIADMRSQRQIAENVLAAYLGPQTGPHVLAGRIRRGSGDAVAAVIWSSDLRGFTHYSDHSPPEQVIATLNEVFDLQARAIAEFGGEILKFIGDGLLAIFPVPRPEDARSAAESALAAARHALADLAELSAARTEAGQPALRMVIALHFGTAIYGNIGAAARLDFTVIGPAVNLVSRVEAVAKSLDLPLVVTDDFASLQDEELPSLGLHALRGLERPHELFAPRLQPL